LDTDLSITDIAVFRLDSEADLSLVDRASRTLFALVFILDLIEEFFKFLFLLCRFLFSADLWVAKIFPPFGYS
jgi:hypothetical protein